MQMNATPLQPAASDLSDREPATESGLAEPDKSEVKALGKALAKQVPSLFDRLCAGSKGLLPELACNSAPELAAGHAGASEHSESSRGGNRRISTDIGDPRTRRFSATLFTAELERRLEAGHYRVGKKIASGSTATIFFGARRHRTETVVLKTMTSKSEDATLRAREEYRILTSIQHPSIIQAFELSQAEGLATVVLEHYDGTELLLAVHGQVERCLKESQSCRLTAQLVQAVEYLHSRKIIHCDLRPQNILVSKNLKSLKLIDFGCAVDLEDRAWENYPFPESGPQVACSAPEVILGEEPTPMADVWQVGLCIYFMLSGGLPQRRDHCRATRDVVRSVATQQVAFVSSKWASVPEHVKVLLQCCLTIDKLERPTSKDLLRRSVWLQPMLPQHKQRTSEKSSAKDGAERHLEESQPVSNGLFLPVRNQVESGTLKAPTTTSSCNSTRTTQSAKSALSEDLAGSNLLHLQDFCSNAVIIEPEFERATILLVNYANKTVKVRMHDGTIKVVPADCVQRA